MQDFGTLRNRVEETAQKLTSAQGERQEQTETLIGTLRQLDEKYAAQEQQVAYYRERVEPLEQANEQLSLLMGNLLDLIDNGFSEESLVPMRKASEMATALLTTEMSEETDDSEGTEELVSDDEPVAELEVDEPEALEVDEPEALEPESEGAVELESEAEFIGDMDVEIDADQSVEYLEAAEPDADAASAGLSSEEVLDLVEAETDQEGLSVELSMGDAASPEEEIVGPYSAATDFEMEEEALAKLDEDIDPAVEAEVDASVIAEMDDSEPVSQEPVAVEEPVQDDSITIDEIISDEEMSDIAATADTPEDVGYEDVSAATLELEKEEDAALGFDDLPEVVQIAAVAAQDTESTMEALSEVMAEVVAEDKPEIVLEAEAVDVVAEADGSEMMMTEENVAESEADEAEAIAAIAQAIEKETDSENGTPPAPADIRSLLLRVEALAKKAEAMRLAQGLPDAAEQAVTDGSGEGAAEAPEADAPKQSGAAA